MVSVPFCQADEALLPMAVRRSQGLHCQWPGSRLQHHFLLFILMRSAASSAAPVIVPDVADIAALNEHWVFRVCRRVRIDARVRITSPEHYCRVGYPSGGLRYLIYLFHALSYFLNFTLSYFLFYYHLLTTDDIHASLRLAQPSARDVVDDGALCRACSISDLSDSCRLIVGEDDAEAFDR